MRGWSMNLVCLPVDVWERGPWRVFQLNESTWAVEFQFPDGRAGDVVDPDGTQSWWLTARAAMMWCNFRSQRRSGSRFRVGIGRQVVEVTTPIPVLP